MDFKCALCVLTLVAGIAGSCVGSSCLVDQKSASELMLVQRQASRMTEAKVFDKIENETLVVRGATKPEEETVSYGFMDWGPYPRPTKRPTKTPTEDPTTYPTKSPTDAPTETPTEVPTKYPTKSPTDAPTETPTACLARCSSMLDLGNKDAGPGGEQCQSCMEEENVQCCIDDGGSLDACCEAAGVHAQQQAFCMKPCDKSHCQGCSGVQCQICSEEANVQCCIDDGGSLHACCAAAGAHAQQQFFCKTESPTESSTETPTEGPTDASATGDPHVTNIRGETFNVFRNGHMEFLRVPFKSAYKDANLTMLGIVQDVVGTSDECAQERYITSVLFGGAWLGDQKLNASIEDGELVARLGSNETSFARVNPSDHQMPIGKLLHLHVLDNEQLQLCTNVQMCIGVSAAGSHAGKHFFLNLDATSVTALNCRIGGLLGEDSHDAVSTRPLGCLPKLTKKNADAISFATAEK